MTQVGESQWKQNHDETAIAIMSYLILSPTSVRLTDEKRIVVGMQEH